MLREHQNVLAGLPQHHHDVQNPTIVSGKRRKNRKSQFTQHKETHRSHVYQSLHVADGWDVKPEATLRGVKYNLMTSDLLQS